MSSFAAKAQVAQVARRSLARLRDVCRAGDLGTLAAVEAHTGDIKDPEARALFASLPTVTPATLPEELVAHGLVPSVPQGLAAAAERPKYRLDRPLFVRTTVQHTSPNPRRPVGAFQADGPNVFTHLGRLKKQRGDELLVEVEGAPTLQAFSRADVFAWNEPYGVPAAGGVLSGVQIDFAAPRWKAFVCAGFVDIGEEAAVLDFGAPAHELERRQAELVRRLGAHVRMHYPGRGQGYAGPRAQSLIDGGAGVCFVQRAVAGAYLQCFARLLNFEVQVANGRTLRQGLPHGFVVVTLLPSGSRWVCDPAWGEPLNDLRVAFFGPGWGHDRRLEGFEGEHVVAVRPSQIDLPKAEGT